MAGYSGKPLAKKLGIKSGTRVRTENAPAHYAELIADAPADAVVSTRLRRNVNIWHLFCDSQTALQRRLPAIAEAIERDGAIWVSWPKKASGVASDMSEGAIRRAATPLGLVDVKVCAVDDTWSGLKLMIRKDLR